MRGFDEANAKILQRICKAWNKVGRKDKELRGSSNGVIGDYHKWLKSRTQGITWLQKLKCLNGEEAEVPEESEEMQALKAELEKTKVAKEKLKVVVTRVRKKCDWLKDINMSLVEGLEQETKKARKEEWSRNKFQGALLGSSNELKLRKVERDKSRMENVMLKDKLRNCQRSKGSLKEQLRKTEENMLIIIDQYKEKVNLTASHGRC